MDVCSQHQQGVWVSLSTHPRLLLFPRVMGKEAETHLQSILLGLQGGDRDSGTRQAGAAASTEHPGTGQRRWVAQAAVSAMGKSSP